MIKALGRLVLLTAAQANTTDAALSRLASAKDRPNQRTFFDFGHAQGQMVLQAVDKPRKVKFV
jgi:hypothetical protein